MKDTNTDIILYNSNCFFLTFLYQCTLNLYVIDLWLSVHCMSFLCICCYLCPFGSCVLRSARVPRQRLVPRLPIHGGQHGAVCVRGRLQTGRRQPPHRRLPGGRHLEQRGSSSPLFTWANRALCFYANSMLKSPASLNRSSQFLYRSPSPLSESNVGQVIGEINNNDLIFCGLATQTRQMLWCGMSPFWPESPLAHKAHQSGRSQMTVYYAFRGQRKRDAH